MSAPAGAARARSDLATRCRRAPPWVEELAALSDRELLGAFAAHRDEHTARAEPARAGEMRRACTEGDVAAVRRLHDAGVLEPGALRNVAGNTALTLTATES